MPILDEIMAPVKSEMDVFQKTFKTSMKSSVPLLDKITHYIVKRKGKQMRPLFVFLSAKMHGEISPSTHTAASLIELLHTATLVHDDVVDDAYERRGFLSLNALWKNKIAVLVGDFLLSRGMLIGLENQEHGLLEIVSKSVKEMSEGELLQIEKARRLDITEEVYFEIIRKKTATLIASCCASGAASAKVTSTTQEQMWRFGELVGIAFQLKDDLLDYGNDDIGKPTGIDIKEKKMTLPLIYTLQHTSGSEKRKIINTVKNHSDNADRVAEVIALVNKSGGMEYAHEKMNTYTSKALQALEEFPQNEFNEKLAKLVNYSIDRKK